MSDSSTDQPPGLLLRLIKDQRVAFLLVGGFNTLMGYSLFVLFQHLIGRHIPAGYMVSLVCSYSVGVMIAFFMHRYLVFKVRGQFWLDFVRFVAVNTVGFGLNAVLLPVAVEVMGLQTFVAQGVVTLFVAVASYCGHKYFSFRRQDTSNQPA